MMLVARTLSMVRRAAMGEALNQTCYDFWGENDYANTHKMRRQSRNKANQICIHAKIDRAVAIRYYTLLIIVHSSQLRMFR